MTDLMEKDLHAVGTFFIEPSSRVLRDFESFEGLYHLLWINEITNFNSSKN